MGLVAIKNRTFTFLTHAYICREGQKKQTEGNMLNRSK